jgi:uncharacterized membrane protein YgdD (TMEM256/DUF423 family)
VSPTGHDALRRGLAAAGALFAALAIALGAYAAHGLPADAAARMQTPLLYLLVHGIALAALAPRQRNAIELGALGGFVFGVLLFCGSVIGAVLADWSTRLAPLGGMLLIVAWVVLAFGLMRRD